MRQVDNEGWEEFDAFFRRQRATSGNGEAQNGTNEVRRELAALSRRQGELVKRLDTLPYSHDLGNPYIFYEGAFDNRGTTRRSLILMRDQLNDIPDIDHLALTTLNKRPTKGILPAIHLPDYFEIDTQTKLQIGKHTDPKTQPQAEGLLASDQIIKSNLYTVYVLGPGDRHGKISGFPRSIIDDRPDVGDIELPNKHVVVDIGPEDVLLISRALDLLGEAII